MCEVSPVELIDVLDVPKESAHLLRMDGQVGLIDDVSQVILKGIRRRKTQTSHFFNHFSTFCVT